MLCSERISSSLLVQRSRTAHQKASSGNLLELNMRTYVLGAGASYRIYPLGGSLLEHIDGFIKSWGKWFERFDYEKEWPATLKWLADNP